MGRQVRFVLLFVYTCCVVRVYVLFVDTYVYLGSSFHCVAYTMSMKHMHTYVYHLTAVKPHTHSPTHSTHSLTHPHPLPHPPITVGLTLVVDFGQFQLDTDSEATSQLPVDQQTLFECYTLQGSNFSADLIDGHFTWPIQKQEQVHEQHPQAEEEEGEEEAAGGSSSTEQQETAVVKPAEKTMLTTTTTGTPIRPTTTTTTSTYTTIPLLGQCGATMHVKLARSNPTASGAQKHPLMQVQAVVPRFTLYFSPGRLRRLMTVINAVLPGMLYGGGVVCFVDCCFLCTHTHMYVHARTHIHTHICTCMYTHTHTYMYMPIPCISQQPQRMTPPHLVLMHGLLQLITWGRYVCVCVVHDTLPNADHIRPPHLQPITHHTHHTPTTTQIKMLQYRGIGQQRAHWDKVFAALYRGRLYAFPSRGSTQVLTVNQVWNQQRTMRLGADVAHGHAHVLAVVGADMSASEGLRGLYDGGALVFRTKEEGQVCGLGGC